MGHDSHNNNFPVEQEPLILKEESHYIELSIKKHRSNGKDFRVVHVKMMENSPVKRHTSSIKYPQNQFEDDDIALSPITTDVNTTPNEEKTFRKMGKFILNMIP